jgi:predicted dehydrogenase
LGKSIEIVVHKKGKDSMNAKKLRVIQIGTGSWGFSWVEKALHSSKAELVGLVDMKQEMLDYAVERYHLDPRICFLTLKDAVEHVDADAAFIVVPPAFHKDVALEAFGYGLHCLVEKPLAENMEDAMAMADAAEQAGKKLMTSQNYRFKRAPQTVKKLIEQGFAGNIGSVFINFQKAPHFTGFRTEMFEPLIQDMSIHHFDQIRGILGMDPVRIRAHSWNTGWSWFKGNPVASVLFEMENGAVVSYNGNWVSSGWETTWDGDWRIQGSEGEIHWYNNQVVLHPSDLFVSVFQDGAVERDGDLVFDLVEMQEEERMAAIAEFASAIFEDREPETSGRDNLYSLAMVIGAKYAAKTGECVEVAELLDPKYFQKFSHIDE